jgi:hypothetical protein
MSPFNRKIVISYLIAAAINFSFFPERRVLLIASVVFPVNDNRWQRCWCPVQKLHFLQLLLKNKEYPLIYIQEVSRR